MRLLIFVSFLIFSVSSFAVSTSKCEKMDWFEFGYTEAKKGVPLDKAKKTLDSCRKKEIEVSEEELGRGWRKGIEKYCGDYNAFMMGKNGKKKTKACPLDLKNSFFEKYTLGRAVVKEEKGLSKVKSKLAGVYKKKKKLESKMAKTDKEIQLLERKKTQFEVKLKTLNATAPSKGSGSSSKPFAPRKSMKISN